MSSFATATAPAVVATATSSSVVISNVIYLIGAVVLFVIVTTVIVLRHRKPKSVQSNMDTFHRGLAALAPESGKVVRRRAGAMPPLRPGGVRRGELRPRTDDASADAGGPGPQPRAGAETG